MAGELKMEQELKLNGEWAGFDLVKLGSHVPMIYWRGDIVLVSGCITTVAPMKNQAGWDLTVGWVDPRGSPPNNVSFLAPTSMSRYEGMYQCGTSMMLRHDGRITINFSKSTNPMVLHFSGLACVISHDEPIPIQIAQYELRDWLMQMSSKAKAQEKESAPEQWALLPDEANPPALRRCGSYVFLQGELQEATFGPLSQHVAVLPDHLRPRREIRCLASLLREEDDVVEHSVALTIRPNGTISVQGGKVRMVDQKGNMRVLQQKKKGRLCLSGVRFSLVDGVAVTPSQMVQQLSKDKQDALTGKAKVDYLMGTAYNKSAVTAAAMRQGDLVMLEGHLSWNAARPLNSKQPLATLPQGHWPPHRQCFFTRGGSDLEERRRVDVDQYGRIFCPEGARGGRVELTGILFVAAAKPPEPPRPRDPDWDDLKLQYQRNEVSVVTTTFEGCELLEHFVRCSNYHEWRFIEYDFGRHAGRKMLLPLGPVPLRGHEKWDPMNLGHREDALWKEVKGHLCDKYGITSFQTLLHLSPMMFDRVVQGLQMKKEDRAYLTEKRSKMRQEWSMKRQPGLTYTHLHGLATEIVDQMFQHWDFKAQLQGALQSDFRAPSTIEHLFPQRKSRDDWFIRKHVKQCDMQRFEECRQFFYLYETTGNNMTHCSLMGASDVFTTTGKWYFPDTPEVQKQLCENIDWLFQRQMYLYMSERQTARFPFIEDLDVQCRVDWEGELPPNQKPRPPDDLLIKRPTRTGDKVDGDPGEMMRRRAHAIHMVYPQLEFLEVLVYCASGYNKGKDMLKSSFHLVWPQLVVDADRAPVIRHVTLGLFQKETMRPGSFLSHLQKRLLQLHESNNWELVFDSTTINARNGLRLPYNDKASMVIDSAEDRQKVKEGKLSKTKAFKKRVKEERPSRAVGKIRFEFDKDPKTGMDIISSARWVKDDKDFTIAQWIEMGSCRIDPHRPDPISLTEWQLQHEVLTMLPTKPGEQFYFEGEADGEGGHWVTHKPFPQIRRCALETREFTLQFNEAVSDEQDALKEEQHYELLRHMVGSWVSLTDTQAIWRSAALTQCEAKVPDRLWGCRRIRRPAEVAYIKKLGKVVIDGPPDVVEALIRALKLLTKPDDNAVMPIYDVSKISQ